MVNGDPVMADDLQQEILALLSEGPWLVGETPRKGNLQRRFSEQTSGLRDALAAAVEDNLQPLIADGKAVSVTCEDVRVVPGVGTTFTVSVLRPGKSDPERYPIQPTGGGT